MTNGCGFCVELEFQTSGTLYSFPCADVRCCARFIFSSITLDLFQGLNSASALACAWVAIFPRPTLHPYPIRAKARPANDSPAFTLV